MVPVYLRIPDNYSSTENLFRARNYCHDANTLALDATWIPPSFAQAPDSPGWPRTPSAVHGCCHSSLSLSSYLCFPGCSTLGRLSRAFPLPFLSSFPAPTCLAVCSATSYEFRGFAGQKAAPSRTPLGLFRTFSLPRLQSISLSHHLQTLCPTWAKQGLG